MCGGGESCLHNCLALSFIQCPRWKKHISQVFVQLWLLRPMAGDSHYWWQEWCAWCQAERTCPSGSVAHVLPGWLIPPTAGDVGEWSVSGFSPEPGVAECSHFLPSPHVSGSQLLPQTEISSWAWVSTPSPGWRTCVSHASHCRKCEYSHFRRCSRDQVMSEPKFPCHKEEGFLQIQRAKIQGVLAGEGCLSCSHAGKSASWSCL